MCVRGLLLVLFHNVFFVKEGNAFGLLKQMNDPKLMHSNDSFNKYETNFCPLISSKGTHQKMPRNGLFKSTQFRCITFYAHFCIALNWLKAMSHPNYLNALFYIGQARLALSTKIDFSSSMTVGDFSSSPRSNHVLWSIRRERHSI